MNLGGYDIGVCSWSLKPASIAGLVSDLDTLQLDHTQLALIPLLSLDESQLQSELNHLSSSEIALTGGMLNFPGENYASIGMIRRTGGFVPAENWPERLDIALRAGALANKIGIDRISVHLGFLPPGSDPGYSTLIGRCGEIARAYGDLGIELLLETGQERASDLLQFLNDLNARHVGVNLDPANMILYGSGDPIEAAQTLGRHIMHVHIKDAVPSATPGIEWGKEKPFGQGALDHRAFFKALAAIEYTGPLLIECESGADRLANVKVAISKLKSLLA